MIKIWNKIWDNIYIIDNSRTILILEPKMIDGKLIIVISKLIDISLIYWYFYYKV